MKKIVYILKSFALKAGVERVMSDKMNELAARGYDVTLITYEQGRHPHAFPLHPSVHHVDLDTRFLEIMRYGLLRRMPMMKRLRRQFRSRLQAALDDIQPQVLVVSTCSIKLMDIIFSVHTDAHRIIESHAPCYSVKKSFYYRNNIFLRTVARWYDDWMLGQARKADAVVTLTQGDAKEWNRYTSKTYVIPNPVTAYPQVVKRHDGSGRRIICAGRLNFEKRYDRMIDAFARVADQCPEWHVDIFGEGDDKAALQEKIRHHHLEHRIRINAPTSDIYTEYQNSEFFVLSSQYEGFGLVLVESMSCGIPCVAFRCKYGPEDIIDDGINGLLVEDGNVTELAEKIRWMATHTEERLRMGLKAREDVRRYERNAIMQQWITLFEQFF